MVAINKILFVMSILLMLFTIGMASPLEMLHHRSKRGCPSDYTSCNSYGCCKSGCGPSWYRNNYGSCSYKSCPRGQTACAGGNNNCCDIKCRSGYITCYGGSTSTSGSTYCCPSGNTCCAFTYSTSNGGGGCCSSAVMAAAAKQSCGSMNQRCCPEGNYGPFCVDGSCATSGFCLTSG